MKKITISDLFAMKNKQKIVMITAYDALFAKLFDDYADMILVGDSLNMSFNGKNETIGLSVKEMIYHAKAVRTGSKRAFLVVDVPFGAIYSKKVALKNCIEIYKKTGCDAVKIEGGSEIKGIVKALSQNGVGVMGHIGLKPQLSRKEGGFKVAGRDEETAKKILDDAIELELAGAGLLLLEGIPSELGKKITNSVKIPTIGIGAGSDTDGQVLVWSDAFGFFEEFKPKFVKRFLDGANLIRNAIQDYADEVRTKKFPSSEHEYTK